MRKSTKKAENGSILLNRFNFSGFSSSSTWIEYFESNKEHNLTLIETL